MNLTAISPVNTMPHVMPDTTAIPEHTPLSIGNAGGFARVGIKGAGAADWLAGHGIAIPSRANAWAVQGNLLVMRLGLGEFLLEDQSGRGLPPALAALEIAMHARPLPPRTYPVARADAAFTLEGREVLELFSELCALDLQAELAEAGRLLMTQVAGISVILLRQSLPGRDVYRLWCDGTYGPYLAHTLAAVAADISAGRPAETGEAPGSTDFISSNASATFTKGNQA